MLGGPLSDDEDPRARDQASVAPSHPGRTVEAAETIARLVRYLTDAAGSRDGMPTPAEVHRVLSELATATEALDQLLHQILDLLVELTTSDAYDDRRDRPAGDTLGEAAAELAGARVTAHLLAEQLTHAAAHAAHLEVADPD